MPSLMSMLAYSSIIMGGAFIVFSILALLVGRLYCSFICPFGILMDIFRYIATIPARSKFLNNTKLGKFVKKKFYFLKYEKSYTITRGIFLGLAILFIAFGFGSLLGFIDPYSLYGKIFATTLHPLNSEITTFVSTTLYSFEVYSVDPALGYSGVSIVSFSIALAILIVIAIASAVRGRIYCNTVCPVGAFLGLLSRFSLFKLSIDKEACKLCGMCERGCKAQCIDAKNKHIDNSKCVLCFNCAKQCHKNAIKFEYRYKKGKDNE